MPGSREGSLEFACVVPGKTSAICDVEAEPMAEPISGRGAAAHLTGSLDIRSCPCESLQRMA